MKPENKSNLKYFLKDDICQETNFRNTDQNIGVLSPPIEKLAPPDARKILLLEPGRLWDRRNALKISHFASGITVEIYKPGSNY